MSRARVLADFVGGTTTISGNPTFTGSTSGAGKVLKTAVSEITASTSRSSATSFADDLDFGSFTPSATASTILIYGVANLDSDSSNYCQYKWVIDGTDYLSTGSTPFCTHQFYSSTSLNNNGFMPSTIFTSVSNTDGGAITVVCQGKVNGGILYVNRSRNASQGGSPSTVLFMEVSN
tara:strand:+ start:1022 stop:1552 length:531 start_codon:yes stop_codon:yes gene_type:complete